MAKSKKTEKSITLNELASEMRAEFKKIDGRFNTLDTKFTNQLNQEIGDLASAMKTGFDEVQDQFVKIDQNHHLFIDRFEKIEADVHDIKVIVGPLVSFSAEHDRRFGKVETRVRRLEYKVGLAKLGDKASD